MEERKREPYLDVVRFVAICLVVVHHVRDYAGDPAAYAGMPWLDNLSLTTDVAVFLAVSGYLARSLMRSCDLAKLVRRLVAYLWPVLTLAVLGSALLQCVLTGTVRPPPSGWLRHAFTAGWFFWCLALCEGLTFAAHWFARGRTWLLAGLLAAGLLGLWALPVGMFHAVEMLPAYWFGMFALPRLLASKRVRPIGAVALALHLLAVSVCGDFVQCGLSYHHDFVRIFTLTPRTLGLQLARWAIAMTGAAGCIIAIRELIARCPAFGRLAPLGTQTLGVYFFQGHLLVIYFATIGWTGGGVAGRLALSLLCFALAFSLSWLTHRWRPLAAIIWNPLLFKYGKVRYGNFRIHY